MAQAKLSQDKKRVLLRSSREAVDNTLYQLRHHFRRQRWIGAYNTYRDDCIGTLQRRVTRTSFNVNHRHLGQYIVASVATHCADGWSFLGKAIDSYLRGDCHTACHLAYYAELRAAMSILAAEGIGVFNDRHFILDSTNECRLIGRCRGDRGPGPGTHQFTWLALEHWSELKRSVEVMARIIRPGGKALSDWVFNFEPGLTLRSISRRWLKTWGLDLKHWVKDRKARNNSSYRPKDFSNDWRVDIPKILDFLNDLWFLTQPFDSDSRFANFDTFLLRECLHLAFQARTGKKPKDDFSSYCNKVDKTIKNTNPTGLSENGWKKVLSNGRTSIIIEQAKSDYQITNPDYPLQVMGRATLLLRLATGVSARLLDDAGVIETLGFWRDSLGLKSGLWEEKDSFEDLTDFLWGTVEDALQEIGEWYNNNDLSKVELKSLRNSLQAELSTLGECERIALWGLGL